ncbi:MAG: MerR family transcriptional regulator [Saccharospirillaceae bacterium]|nr:MerR family transcriptional regulator [Pseudomonadales bacterium]NRB77861.1 MerR family transcriptional regulator [Saccharospirillaceae bacterium]
MQEAQTNNELPGIPEKRQFTIGEVAQLCAVKTHVLRFWEKEFSQLEPNTRRGNRRYYNHKDVLVVRQIRSLLHEQGFTIIGARAQLAKMNNKHKNNSEESHINDNEISQMLAELEEVFDILSN